MEYVIGILLGVLFIALMNYLSGEKWLLFNNLRRTFQTLRNIKRGFMHNRNPYYLPSASESKKEKGE